MARPKLKPASREDTLFGLLSKEEAAKHIAAGTRHVHSSALGQRDPLATITLEALTYHKLPEYPWVLTSTATLITVEKSKARYDAIQVVSADPHVAKKRELKEKTSYVLEELLSNAIFHSYHLPSGEPKYQRLQSAQLAPQERVTIHFKATDKGLFLSVTDQGGSHSFDHVARALDRCYSKGSRQIETKESGAGLGLYMIFDAVTHWNIASVAGKNTTVSVWISDKKHFDPDIFSFNFFEGG